MENLPIFVKDLSLAGSLALIFYLTVKTILSNNRETINTLLKENREQREEFTKVITNHLHHGTEAMTNLTAAVERLDKSTRRLPEVFIESIKKIYDPKLYKKRAIVETRSKTKP